MSAYPTIPGIDARLFQLSPSGMTEQQRKLALNNARKYLTKQRENFLGYQACQSLDYEELHRYLDFHVNNIADPFANSNFTVNSKFMERPVLDYYASLWNAKWPYDPKDRESYWGYVLSMGATEGNVYGVWNARDYLAGKFLITDAADAKRVRERLAARKEAHVAPRLVYRQAHSVRAHGRSAQTKASTENAFTPIAFFSEDTHYSIIKAMRVLDIQTFSEVGRRLYPKECPLGKEWPEEVPSKDGPLGPGSIDVEALAKLVEFFAAKGYPPLVILNYGTTFKGAYDDVEAVGEKLRPILEKRGLWERKVYYDPKDPQRYDTRNGFWIHVDAALGGTYMPFIEKAYLARRIKQRGPNFDFRLPFVHSISASGRKWVGAPWPCGIFMTKVKTQLQPPDDPAYIGAPDTTFAGSRNGFSAMILWDFLAKRSHADQVKRALETEKIAGYIEKRLRSLQKKIKLDLWVERSPLSLTVRFRKPVDSIVLKYSLSGESMYVPLDDGRVVERKFAHMFAMAHVTKERVDDIIEELGSQSSFAPDAEKPAEHVEALSGDANRLQRVPRIGRGFK